jgi:hypothetical protein
MDILTDHESSIPLFPFHRVREEAMEYRTTCTLSFKDKKENRFRTALIRIPPGRSGPPKGEPTEGNEHAAYLDERRFEDWRKGLAIANTKKEDFGGLWANSVGIAIDKGNIQFQQSYICIWGGKIPREWIVDEDLKDLAEDEN